MLNFKMQLKDKIRHTDNKAGKWGSHFFNFAYAQKCSKLKKSCCEPESKDLCFVFFVDVFFFNAKIPSVVYEFYLVLQTEFWKIQGLL